MLTAQGGPSQRERERKPRAAQARRARSASPANEGCDSPGLPSGCPCAPVLPSHPPLLCALPLFQGSLSFLGGDAPPPTGATGRAQDLGRDPARLGSTASALPGLPVARPLSTLSVQHVPARGTGPGHGGEGAPRAPLLGCAVSLGQVTCPGRQKREQLGANSVSVRPPGKHAAAPSLHSSIGAERTQKGGIVLEGSEAEPPALDAAWLLSETSRGTQGGREPGSPRLSRHLPLLDW